MVEQVEQLLTHNTASHSLQALTDVLFHLCILARVSM